MKKTGLILLMNAAMVLTLAPLPSFARMEDYGARRYTQVGRSRGHEDHGNRVIIDRRRGPGWGGVAAAGIIGAVAGLALGSAIGAPAVAGPPVVSTIVPGLPGACVTVPSYNGAVIYNCGNIYYQPFYQGGALMYEVIPAP